MYYDEEPYYNPEEFLEEYEVNLRDILAEAVNRKIKDTISELSSLKCRNTELEKEIKELKSSLHNTNRIHKEQLDKALKENTKEVERKMSCGITPHDKIWLINSESSHKKCGQCNGKGKVEVEVLGKMTKVNCPHCSNGNVYKSRYFPGEDIVSSIYFDLHREDRNNKNSGTILTVRDIYLDKYDSSMKPERLYKTLEDCQERCDELNADNKE